MSAEPQAEQSGPTAAGTAQGERVISEGVVREFAEDHGTTFTVARDVLEDAGYTVEDSPRRRGRVTKADLVAENAALRGQLAEAQNLMAFGEPVLPSSWLGVRQCVYCACTSNKAHVPIVHTSDCPWWRAKTALAALDPSGQRGGAL
jgi:hypothetical protein